MKSEKRIRPVNLIVSKEEAKSNILKQIKEGKSLIEQEIKNREDLEELISKKHEWSDFNSELLLRFFDGDEICKEYSISSAGIIKINPSFQEEISLIKDNINKQISILNSIYRRLDIIPENISNLNNSQKKTLNALDKIELLVNRFHTIVRQLKIRYQKRETIEINDEYDVQDLLHALLKIFFDDIRNEEWTPSYAGSSARVDFLLKKEKIVIEVKKTRKTLREKQIGNELIIDIERYKVHPACKILLCFVYDPEGYVSNPTGLENDLSRKNNNFEVKVLIVPKGY